jgi:hypothetical protein
MIGQAAARRAVPAQDGRREGAPVRACRDVLFAERDGAAVLLDLGREVFLGLDEVGTLIWRGVQQGSSTDCIARTLSEEYDVSYEVARDDVTRFVHELVERGLAVSP